MNKLEYICILSSEEMFKVYLEVYNSDNNSNNFFIKELRKDDIKTKVMTIRKVELMGCFVERLSKDSRLYKVIKKWYNEV